MAEKPVKPRGREQKRQPATLAMFEWVDRNDMVKYAGTLRSRPGSSVPPGPALPPRRGRGNSAGWTFRTHVG